MFLSVLRIRPSLSASSATSATLEMHCIESGGCSSLSIGLLADDATSYLEVYSANPCSASLCKSKMYLIGFIWESWKITFRIQKTFVDFWCRGLTDFTLQAKVEDREFSELTSSMYKVAARKESMHFTNWGCSMNLTAPNGTSPALFLQAVTHHSEWLSNPEILLGSFVEFDAWAKVSSLWRIQLDTTGAIRSISPKKSASIQYLVRLYWRTH